MTAHEKKNPSDKEALGILFVLFLVVGGGWYAWRLLNPPAPKVQPLNSLAVETVRSMCLPQLEAAAGEGGQRVFDAAGSPRWDDSEWAWVGSVTLQTGQPADFSCVVYGDNAQSASVAAARVLPR